MQVVSRIEFLTELLGIVRVARSGFEIDYGIEFTAAAETSVNNPV